MGGVLRSQALEDNGLLLQTPAAAENNKELLQREAYKKKKKVVLKRNGVPLGLRQVSKGGLRASYIEEVLVGGAPQA